MNARVAGAAGTRVTVVGGGLAGISAALACADAGAEVTLLERRRRLGGLTWSFQHDGRSVDNGQHVFLRCCTSYLAFLRRIGSADDVVLQPRLDVTVLAPGAPGGAPVTSRLRRDDWPAPLHLARALLAYRHLSVAERVRLGPAAWALRRMDLDDTALDEETFGSWLRRHGQSSAAIANLWDVLTVATVNLGAAEASLAMGAKVFQTGLLTERGAGDIGWARIPLGRLHGERGAAALRAAGVRVELATRVRAVDVGEGSGFAVRSEAGELDTDAVVVALPHDEAATVLPPDSVANQDSLHRLGTSPIVDVHVAYDRQVTALALAAGLDTAAQWIFDRTDSSGTQAPEQYLAVSLSAADAELGLHPDDLARRITNELSRLLPAARQARVISTLVTKERSATFRAVPGTARLRPGPATRRAGLAVAGAWTDTGWPATMEGAVRSGMAAARRALAETGAPRPLSEEVA